MPYSSGYSNPSSSAGYGGASAQAANPYAPNTSASPQAPANGTASLGSVLTGFGIPTDGDKVRWPLAFRLMTPEQGRDLLEPVEALLQVAATRAAAGQATPRMLEQATRAVEKLRRWLQSRDLAETTTRDAHTFLRQLHRALKAMGS